MRTSSLQWLGSFRLELADCCRGQSLTWLDGLHLVWMLLVEKVSSGERSEKEEGRVLERVLGCDGRSLDLASVVRCSNPTDEAHEVLFRLVSCEQSSRLEFLGEEQVELRELDVLYLGDELETGMG